MIITSVERQKKNKRRLSIYVDGQYYGSLIDEVFAASGFREGCEFDEEKFLQLKSKDEVRAAFDMALRFLEKRARSEHEISEKLKSADFSDEAIAAVIDKLKEYQYLDDRQFAKMLLNEETCIKYGSKRSAIMRMKKYGVTEEAVQQVIDGYSEQDEYENALLWAKKLNKRHMSEENLQKKKQKITSAMARRGFGWEMINHAVREVMGNDTFYE